MKIEINKTFSFQNNLAPFRVGEKQIVSLFTLVKFFPHVVFHFFPVLRVEMKNFEINKTFSFQNNLAPFRVGEKQIISL
jgi:hypothetical protein